MTREGNICIIGGAGFLGRHLIRAFEGKREHRVKVLVRSGKSVYPCEKNMSFVKGDLLDFSSLLTFVEPNDIVVNLAFLKDQSLEKNIRAISNLTKACQTVGIRRLLHCSTAIVVGRSEETPIVENTSCRPYTKYEKTKYLIEQWLLNHWKGKEELVIIRPTAVFGEHGQNLMKLAGEISQGKRWIWLSKSLLFGKRRFNLVYIENVVAAILFLAFLGKNISGQRFIISDDEANENNYWDVSKMLANCFDENFPFRAHFFPVLRPFLPFLLRLVGRGNVNPNREYSCEKLLAEGFKKPISFSEGIDCFASWYRDGRVIL